MEGGVPLENMKKFPKYRKRTWLIFFAVLFSFLFTGCAKETSPMPVLRKASENLSLNIQKTYRSEVYGVQINPSFPAAARPVPGAANPAEKSGEDVELSVKAAFLFDLTNGRVLYEKNCYEKIYPASTTKLLTAYFLLSYMKEHGIQSSDTYVIRADNCGITRVGAKLFGFREGDTVTLDLLLNALLVYSANDAAVAIIEYIAAREGASYEDTLQWMNDTAARLGATHTNFTNPHGLHELEHKTTAYDLYLIFDACMNYPEFVPIIGQNSYLASYTGADGTKKEVALEATNQYFLNLYTPPNGVTVLGGKTGSTASAGDCFITLSQYGERTYLSAIFGAETYEDLYLQMNRLLEMECSDYF